jgi:hypothetical protein
MIRSRFTQIGVAAAICATTAATIGIASGAAAPSKNATRSGAPGRGLSGAAERGLIPGPPPPGASFQRGTMSGAKLPRPPKGAPVLLFGGPPLHSEMVVPNKAGDDFITITQDNGKVESVSSDQLTITEGTSTATYKTVTIDVPADAKILRNGKKAELSDLQAGDQVHASVSSEGSFLFASDGNFLKHVTRNGRGLPPPPGFGGGIPAGPPAMGLPPRQGGNNKN